MADVAHITVRWMTRRDLDRVLELAAKMPEAPHWPDAAYRRALDPESNPRRVALVADGGPTAAILGFAMASLLPPQAELETIAVGPELRRLGIGRRLFDALADELRMAGVNEVLLEVRPSNQPAIAFYRRLGFATVGLRSLYYTDPIEDALQMSLGLG